LIVIGGEILRQRRLLKQRRFSNGCISSSGPRQNVILALAYSRVYELTKSSYHVKSIEGRYSRLQGSQTAFRHIHNYQSTMRKPTSRWSF